MPSTFSKKAPSFGVGKRFKSHRSKDSFSTRPIQYTNTSEFSPERSRDKGFSFGAAREAFDKVYVKEKPNLNDPAIPGPGKYTLKGFVDINKYDNR